MMVEFREIGRERDVLNVSEEWVDRVCAIYIRTMNQPTPILTPCTQQLKSISSLNYFLY